MSETTFKITLDHAQADAALAKVRTEVGTLGGAEKQLAASIKSVETSMTSQTAAATKNASALSTMQASAKKLRVALGPTAAAVSLVSSSMGGMGGEMGKAVAGAGQVAAAFGAGGPLAAGFVAGMFAVDAFTRALQNMNAAQDASLKARYAGVDAVAAETLAIRLQLEQGLEPEAKQIAELERLKEKQTENNKKAAEARRQYADLLREESKLRITQAKDAQGNIRDLDAEKKALKALPGMYLGQNEEIKKLIEQKTRLVSVTKEAAKENKLFADFTIAPGNDLGEQFDPSQNEEARQRQWEAAEAQRESNRQVEMDRAREVERALAMQAREAQEERYAIEFEGWQKRQALEMAQQEKTAALTEQYAGRLADIGQNLVADLVAQREHAFERAALTIAAETGQVLIGEGGKLAGFAVTSALTGNAPAAVAQGAGSAGLIAAGIGLGGTAMGLGSLLGNGPGGSALTTPGAQAPRQLGSGAGGGSGGNVTIVYGGASGPSADMGAQNVTIAQGLAADRRFDEVVRR